MEILQDIADNMKAIKENASLKAMKENQLSNIQRDAKANIHFYGKRVNEQLSKYTSSSRKDKKHYEQLRKDYMLLQFCLQEYSVSRLLEIDLTNNYSQDQLQKTRQEIEDLSQSYKDLNRTLRHEISEHFLWKKPQNVIPVLASGAVYGIGEVVKKTPLGDTGLDEKLIAVGEHGFDRLDRREERHTAKVLNDKKGILLDLFSQKLHLMEKVCYEPVELIYDGDDAYLKIED